jgi:hypothetical protein
MLYARTHIYARMKFLIHDGRGVCRAEGKSENAKIRNARCTLSLLPAAAGAAQNKACSDVINYHTLEAKISPDL